MATGMGQSGGSFAWPDVPELGYDTWAGMSGVHPDSPLVGGRGAFGGGVSPRFNERRVAITSPDAAGNSGAPMKAHYTELANLKGNPIGWILILSIAYLALSHIALHGSVGGRVGRNRASASAGLNG